MKFLVATLFSLCLILGAQAQLPAVVDPAFFTANAELSPNFKVFWKIEGDSITIAVQAKTTGWVGFGISSTGTMTPNSDVMLGFFNGGAATVEDGFIGANRVPNCGQADNVGVCRDSDPNVGGVNDITESNGSENGGQTTIIWKRKLVTGDGKGDFDFADANLNVIWALGLADPVFPSIDQHPPDLNSRGQVKINFFSGGIEQGNQDQLRKAHGSLMFLAWAIAIPFTSFLARYWKQFSWWFNVHRITNSVAMFVFALTAFILSIVMTTVHFNTPHKIIGLLITIIGTLNPVLGFVADKMFNPNRTKTPIFPDKVHWILGWGALIMAFVNIALGLLEYQAVQGMLVAYIAIAAIICIFLIAFFIINLATKWPKAH